MGNGKMSQKVASTSPVGHAFILHRALLNLSNIINYKKKKNPTEAAGADLLSFIRANIFTNKTRGFVLPVLIFWLISYS